jgi:hypothetical protein
MAPPKWLNRYLALDFSAPTMLEPSLTNVGLKRDLENKGSIANGVGPKSGERCTRFGLKVLIANDGRPKSWLLSGGGV